VKTLLFSIGDQINDSPPAWGSGFEGYARRVGSRQAQFVIQNSFVALGNGILGYEPRYDRCRCSGFWPRTAHVLKRNLVTYDRTVGRCYVPSLLYTGVHLPQGLSRVPGNPETATLLPKDTAPPSYSGVRLRCQLLGEFAPISPVFACKKAVSKSD